MKNRENQQINEDKEINIVPQVIVGVKAHLSLEALLPPACVTQYITMSSTISAQASDKPQFFFCSGHICSILSRSQHRSSSPQTCISSVIQAVTSMISQEWSCELASRPQADERHLALPAGSDQSTRHDNTLNVASVIHCHQGRELIG